MLTDYFKCPYCKKQIKFNVMNENYVVKCPECQNFVEVEVISFIDARKYKKKEIYREWNYFK